MRLVANTPHLDEFRRLFGDERLDYDKALQQHYASGAPADWSKRFISAYASSHPWEDFAETWAHYFHVIDTLETAEFCGLVIAPQIPQTPGAVFNFHPLDVDLNHLVVSWIALTFAVNSLNRSMGLPDLYPFVLGAGAATKVGFCSASDCKCGDNLATWSTDHRACAGLSRRWVGQRISTRNRGEGQ
jgi:hypothetical protein